MTGGGDLTRLLELFWHPVCTLAELAGAAPRPLAVTLLDRPLAIADVGAGDAADVGAGRVVALADRCLHRSTRLSAGWVEPGAVRCAYHGWLWGADGHCLEIPSMPDGPIPARACIDAYQAQVAHGLVWVRIDSAAGTTVPPHPARHDDTMRVLDGAPYTWPVAGPRRVENFVDLAHFAWVHDGTLGRRDQPVPPLADVRRQEGELRFDYEPPDLQADSRALYGWSRYRMAMPLTVDIEFRLAGGGHRRLWMTTSPISGDRCRTFWSVSRDDDLDGDDRAHLAFQDLVLAEDQPVVCAQHPAAMPLDPVGPDAELSVRTDRVSIEYRRWLRELMAAAGEGAAAVRAALGPAAVPPAAVPPAAVPPAAPDRGPVRPTAGRAAPA